MSGLSVIDSTLLHNRDSLQQKPIIILGEGSMDLSVFNIY
jgi:hypothetical protein